MLGESKPLLCMPPRSIPRPKADITNQFPLSQNSQLVFSVNKHFQQARNWHTSLNLFAAPKFAST